MSLLKSCISVKIIAMFHIIFAAAAVEILPGVATGRERGERAGGSYELDAVRSNQNKLLFHILDLPGSTRALQILFAVNYNEKRYLLL
jgi:hypothetical protein